MAQAGELAASTVGLDFLFPCVSQNVEDYLIDDEKGYKLLFKIYENHPNTNMSHTYLTHFRFGNALAFEKALHDENIFFFFQRMTEIFGQK